jgi:hypothetical protein
LLLVKSRIGMPFSIWSPKEWTKLSTITISGNPLFLIMRKSLILSPLWVSRQLLRERKPWIVFFLELRWAMIDYA